MTNTSWNGNSREEGVKAKVSSVEGMDILWKYTFWVDLLETSHIKA